MPWAKFKLTDLSFTSTCIIVFLRFSVDICFYVFAVFLLHFCCFFLLFCRFIYFHVSVHPLIPRCTLVSFACWIIFVLKLRRVCVCVSFIKTIRWLSTEKKNNCDSICMPILKITCFERVHSVSEHKNDKRTSCSMVFLCMCLFYAFRTSDLEKMKEEGRREKKHTHTIV